MSISQKEIDYVLFNLVTRVLEDILKPKSRCTTKGLIVGSSSKLRLICFSHFSSNGTSFLTVIIILKALIASSLSCLCLFFFDVA